MTQTLQENGIGRLQQEILAVWMHSFPELRTRLNNEILSCFESICEDSIQMIAASIQKQVLYSRLQTNRQVFRKPFMRFREMFLIEEILLGAKPANCLEWGSGYSSLYFPKLLEPGARWISIEHHPEWYHKVHQELVQSPRITFTGLERLLYYFIPADRPEIIQQYPETNTFDTYEDFKTYIEFPQRFGPFDFILVDGRARTDCVEFAQNLLSPGGIMLLHDANVTRYGAPFENFRHSYVFTDLRTNQEGGLWVGSNSERLPHILDIPRHQQYWNDITRLNEAFYAEKRRQGQTNAEIFKARDLFDKIERKFL